MPIDYDKLAKQHGGQATEPAAVDFDALAAEVSAPEGYAAAAAGAETIGEAPWYSKHYLGLPSVTEAMRALPAVGGLIGGAAASPGVITTAGGAALGGAGGEAIRQLAQRAIGGTAPATPEEAALQIGKEAAIQGGAQAVGGVLGKGLSASGKGLMQSAVKPNVSVLKNYRTTAPKLVQTLLDEGINVSPGGLEKLDRLLSATNKEIADAVAGAKGAIPREAVLKRAAPVSKQIAEQVNPKQPLRDVARSLEEFRTGGAIPIQGQNFALVPQTAAPLSVQQAQAMKVGTYQQIGKSYGKMSSAKVEAQKALARGLKEEIERAVPKIKALNQRDAELMAAGEAVGNRVSLAGNRDPVGFAWTASHAPQTFLAALIDRAPAVKSMLARGMYSSAGAATKVSPQLIRAAVLALATEESDAVPAQE